MSDAADRLAREVTITLVNSSAHEELKVERLDPEGHLDKGFEPVHLPHRLAGASNQRRVRATPGESFHFESTAPGRGLVDICRVSPVEFTIADDQGNVLEAFEWQAHRRWQHRVNGVETQVLEEIPPEGDWVALRNPATGYLVLLPLAGQEYLVRDAGGAFRTATDQGLTHRAGDYTIEVSGDKPTVGELRSPNRLLPNAGHCLYGYDLTRIVPIQVNHGVRDGQRRQIFEALEQDSEAYEIVDGNYAVQHGVTFNTINITESTGVTKTIATESDYTDAWSVGVSIRAGGKEKPPAGGQPPADKTPAAGLKASYQEVRQVSRSREKIYSYSATTSRVYELLVDPFVVRLRREFRDAVLEGLAPADESYNQADAACKAAVLVYQEIAGQSATEYLSPEDYWKDVKACADEISRTRAVRTPRAHTRQP